MNVGCRAIEIDDAVQGARVSLRLLYPTRAAARAEPFGPFSLDLAVDGQPEGDALPLVVVSHGTGSTPWIHRDLAAHLARSGFAVVLVQHPGNCRGDDTLAGKPVNLEHRPRHVRLAIDAALGDAVVGPRVAADRVAVIGHSLGATTALTAAGGTPWAAAWETEDGQARPLAVERDPRVGAAVLLAPAVAWFIPEGSLAAVDVPVFVRTGEQDSMTGAFHGDLIARGLDGRVLLDREAVPRAGHFAFVSPYPAAMKSPAIPPSQDPDGFDRAAYLPVLFDQIVGFLRRVGGRGPR